VASALELLLLAQLARNQPQSDTTSRTITSATYQSLSTTYNVPGDDPQPGTTYRLTCFGTGTWGSTVQDLAFSQLLGVAGNVAHTSFAASAAFSWKARCEWIIAAAGASGSANVSVDFLIAETASPPDGLAAATNAVSAVRSLNPVTFNTTVTQALGLQARWASATGAPTITCFGTLFERLGA
jgi:hypothetical protein